MLIPERRSGRRILAVAAALAVAACSSSDAAVPTGAPATAAEPGVRATTNDAPGGSVSAGAGGSRPGGSPASGGAAAGDAASPSTAAGHTAGSTASTIGPLSPTTTAVPVLAGMAPVVDAGNLYSESSAGKLSLAVAGDPAYVYVPSDDDGSITVIDQTTFEIVDRLRSGGKLVQHVVPGFDLTMLYANVSGSNFLRELDPKTGTLGQRIPVDAPYNLYFTPDGTRAVVMAERLDRIDVYDRASWTRLQQVKVPCTSKVRGFSFGGVNHADWSADGRYFLATCEFAGRMLKIDTATMEVVGTLDLEGFGATMQAMPQDVRITPDGQKFYVADMMNGGLWAIDAASFTIVGRVDTGRGAHGIYPSRDGTRFYIANRGRMVDETGRRSRPGEGSVSVLDWRTDVVTATWEVPGGGSPDMGGVSVDGSTLWLSGRYDAEVYAFDTVTGELKARIKTASAPHGLCVWPQPGRYSLGHTGNTR